ncbi:hypothetical protein FGIG_07566 [Fasciola gigantica]|uniref:Rab5 GDP/GTP exchange factor n=1 Tax=Fasciola gigantica TaxID=46835 RepID=A0A504YBH2_FASGI|nr:hypothetical protein FGIG_07566 [Fasciola gigantica]
MATFRVQNPSLLCKNNCGFYGNPSWDGYCSVCYRETYILQGQSRAVTSNLSSVSTQAFSKFEAKRKQLAGKGASTLRQIFRFTKDGNRDRTSTIPEECLQAAAEFNSFLSTLRATVSADISRMVYKLLEELDTMAGSHINQYSVVVQNFYQNVSDRISSSTLYAGLSPPVTESLLNSIERFVTSWTYFWAFASPITDDESVDLKLQEKIRSLHWITPGLLDSPINPRSSTEMAPLEAAALGKKKSSLSNVSQLSISVVYRPFPHFLNRLAFGPFSALIKMNSLYASEDKLMQIVQCCLNVFDSLKIHFQNAQQKAEQSAPAEGSCTSDGKGDETTLVTGANADDFLPTLIWVVLTANPPLLHSNLQFIMRFANQKRLNSGQAGYFFTNLVRLDVYRVLCHSCAVHFLTNLTHQSLNMTEQEFYRCMRTGLPVARPQECVCEGERLMIDNEIQLLDLEDRTAELISGLDRIDQDLNGFDRITRHRFDLIRSDYPLKSVAHKLDPRHLENPHVLLLGPLTPNSDTGNRTETTGNPSSCTDTPQSLLDTEVDEQVNQVLPTPIVPSPYKQQ